MAACWRLSSHTAATLVAVSPLCINAQKRISSRITRTKLRLHNSQLYSSSPQQASLISTQKLSIHSRPALPRLILSCLSLHCPCRTIAITSTPLHLNKRHEEGLVVCTLLPHLASSDKRLILS
ncbi:hypothetical protein BKA80DRAFT_261826 [Phyllosticta citrichinensis]